MVTATLASINRSLCRRRISRQPHLRVFRSLALALPPPVNGEFARQQLVVISSCLLLNRADRAISSPPSGPRFHTSILHPDLSKRPTSLTIAR
ncbi:hypothetical protein SNOG_07722 [Parastagonospora nodorum SN15]|uniref:Uncharacterized protein n=1 Tax=Phaeosphaeria nodorum (strain SN15 / ATCC MYA-4574 / FGSC 10173) TaxID=321614 RepID=Q0UKJ2_PHANO|nr:hypothetical protein SNOG_07722 [Parastagonospora nodorum SN15]EAT85188.1 hypothetical protein SNOG_07722 [Parastagonospora nodorum SN15]